MNAVTNASLILSSVHDSSVTRVSLFSQYQNESNNQRILDFKFCTRQFSD